MDSWGARPGECGGTSDLSCQCKSVHANQYTCHQIVPADCVWAHANWRRERVRGCMHAGISSRVGNETLPGVCKLREICTETLTQTSGAGRPVRSLSHASKAAAKHDKLFNVTRDRVVLDVRQFRRGVCVCV